MAKKFKYNTVKIKDKETQEWQSIPSLGSEYDDSEIKQLLPTDAPTEGKILKVVSVNEDGTFTCEWADAPKPSNVKINGIETVDNNIPIAGINTPGVITVSAAYGAGVDANGRLKITLASNDGINSRSNIGASRFGVIATNNIVPAVKSVVTSQADTEQLSADEQANAQKWLGIYPVEGVEF